MSTAKRKPQQWLALRFTHFALECLGLSRNGPNLVVSHKSRICAASDNLACQGLANGTPTSTAQLLHSMDQRSPLLTYSRDTEREQQYLEQLCYTLYNYTPHIERYRVSNNSGNEESGLLLELSRCITLFKGLGPLISLIRAAVDAAKLSYCFALAHTKHSAWLLSYKSAADLDLSMQKDTIIHALKPLAIDYLYEYPQIVEQLKKSGFFSIGDIIHHIEKESLHSLQKRFGSEFSDYICATLGIEHSLSQASLFQAPAHTYQPPKYFCESLQFDYPVSCCEQLADPVNILLTMLSDELARTQSQTQTIYWNMYDIYHHKESLAVHFDRLHRDQKLAMELTMIQLENQPLPFEIDVLELRCGHILPVTFEHQSLHQQHHAPQQHALATVTAKLNARLGEHAVFTLAPKDAHLPELSFQRCAVGKQAPTKAPVKAAKGSRPSWIFNVPVQLGQRQNTLFWQGKLELLQGPERIEGLWWKKPTGRDYFVAKREDDVRLWVFHDLYKDAWFVHGVFA